MIKSKGKFQEELNNRFPQNKVKIIEYSKASGPIVYECLGCGKIYKKVVRIIYTKIRHYVQFVTVEGQVIVENGFFSRWMAKNFQNWAICLLTFFFLN